MKVSGFNVICGLYCMLQARDTKLTWYFPKLLSIQGFDTLLNKETRVNEEETHTDTDTDDDTTKGEFILKLIAT